MSRKLRWGILSTAAIGRSAVVPAIRASRNGVLAAVASRDPAAATRFAADLGVERALPSYEALIDDAGIDAIYNPLPNGLHAEWSLRAAKAGKAVLCEKPLTVDAASARALIDGCAAAGAPLMEAFMYRFHPQHRRVRQLIDAGTIGDVIEVRAHLSADIVGRKDPGNVRFKADLGGGTLLDMGCYGISICRMIFGERPATVRGWWHKDDRFGVDVTAGAILEFSSGRLGIATASFVAEGLGFYTVIGRKGTIEVPRAIIPGQGDRVPETMIVISDTRGRRTVEDLPAVDQYQIMVEAFADAVLDGRPVPLSNQDTIDNMLVLDAVARSAASGRAEPV